ncbi:hypothetical protein XSR1_440010 [Xenorhabdus szentirmaii DSM 16338]|uniref:Uncharacterized protein n=1 Tax=Xenorhabdus szentirmaii DSM 16338 TaxID=1427518 RepID=W1J0P4_9GAMM|nr:hypothetical protein XSR1_440010 [Xenorhabdus szentirmaii DSM 16338]
MIQIKGIINQIMPFIFIVIFLIKSGLIKLLNIHFNSCRSNYDEHHKTFITICVLSIYPFLNCLKYISILYSSG